jgi:serine/threonine-protein kinase
MSRSIAPVSRIGQLIGGRYEVLSRLGEGGQSAVYRARDVRHGDDVAIKILKAGADADQTERMFREARAMASLQGTAALRVLDQQWTDDGAMCLVTEFLDGRPLDEGLDDLEGRGHRVDIPWLLALLAPIVETLEAAHRDGIVHRDLKPANLFILRAGGVRLLDFGFAKFVRLRGLTASDMVAGSPSYIAPEAWLGKRDLLDHRMDVYGLAAVIFRCIGGRPPFVSNDIAELLRAATRDPRPSLRALRPELPESIDDWVEQSLAIDPAARFQSVRALFRALTSVLG